MRVGPIKERKIDVKGFFPANPADKLIDSISLYANREWPCLLAMVVEQSAEGVAVTDLKGNIRYINNAFAMAHGYEPKELIGKHISIFHTPDQLSAVREAGKQLKKTGLFTGEIWHLRKDGLVFPALMQNTILKDEKGRAVGMIGTIRDISARKQAQEELSKYCNQLEETVKEKTGELRRANIILEEQRAAIERKNIALQELIEELHREKEQIKEDMVLNVENILLPIIQRIKIESGEEEGRNLEILEEELKNLTSSFGRAMSDTKFRLTPREIEICDMIRNGLTSKEISRLLRLSKQSVDGHRNRIRNKLGIRNKKYNLSSVLQNL